MKYFLMIIGLLLFFSCIGGPTSYQPLEPKPMLPFEQVKPVDEKALPEAGAILKYLAALSNEEASGAVVGQNAYHGNQIAEEHPMQGYKRMVDDLYQKTGKWPGMLGLDYEHDQIFSQAELSQANKVLIDYWKAGGLITINWAPLNPWVTEDIGEPYTPHPWNGPGSTRDLSQVDLTELIDPDSQVYTNWYRKLDRIADALLELQEAGVVVLWRPLQEMNGSWFWWGMKSHSNNAEPYIDLWKDMYHYFTDVKGLHNLLWVYSPNHGAPISTTWNRPVDWAYPGDDYVDIVAGTTYDSKLEIKDYSAYLAFGKPLGMGEYACSGSQEKTGEWDTRLYAKVLEEQYPAMGYWVSWHSWPEGHWSIISCKNGKELMEDSYVIDREELEWMRYMEDDNE